MPYSAYFVNSSSDDYRQAMQQAADVVQQFFKKQSKPYSGINPEQILHELQQNVFYPESEQSLGSVINNVAETIVQHAISVNHSFCNAHLHCPVLIPSLAAEVIISALNQSMDSYDQASSATVLEQYVIENLCQLYGYSTDADGIFTSGGTQSNFMGLLLARDYYCQQYLRWNVREHGLPNEFTKFKILCSEIAHFSVKKSAELLGLGHKSIVPITVNADYGIDVVALEICIKKLKSQGDIPIAISATAGTTDFGSIDHLEAIAQLANEHNIWFHVDAAYGSGLILSEKHKPLLAGIDKADSITIDFHKLFYQSISCGAFLVKNKSYFELIKSHSDYLNPEDNKDYGLLDLAYKSIQTTRRFDALKVYISLQTLGHKLSEMIEYTMVLSKQIYDALENNKNFQVLNKPAINAIVFRFEPKEITDVDVLNHINRQIKLRLLLTGEAVIGQTIVNAQDYLKFTLLNPVATIDNLLCLIEKIEKLAFDINQEQRRNQL